MCMERSAMKGLLTQGNPSLYSGTTLWKSCDTEHYGMDDLMLHIGHVYKSEKYFAALHSRPEWIMNGHRLDMGLRYSLK